MKKSYNGWTNYATWRVNLEILGNIEFDHPVTYDYLEEIVEGIVFDNIVDKDCLAAYYARAFINEVNFEEIAEAINKEISLQN